MEIGPSALMTTLTLPYLMLPLLKLLGHSWFWLDPAPLLLPSVEIISGWISGLDLIIWAPANS
ncbi:hypothetical protein B7P43_G07555 [Cryptotermes secundus]|uniref:Uncharacterized protein n=1 Tax=Cryptotermes secundus TaxID=105785 RepID=A0A2J7QI10_9NEOP|nr:hypothetical protein B7P43_G07555 [Cryptotermes secundus]